MPGDKRTTSARIGTKVPRQARALVLAWTSLGIALASHKHRKRTALRPLADVNLAGRDAPEGDVMEDLAYIGLTILVFAVLFLLVKGVERFER